MDDQNRILAGLILSCKPEDLKGVAQKADGSLAVVAPNGMKFVFSPVELDNARDSFCLPAVTSMAEPASVPLGDLCHADIEASRHAAHTPPTATSAVSGLGLVTGSGSANRTSMAEPASVPHGVLCRAGIEAREHGVPNPPASTGSVTGAASRRRRKEVRP